MLSLSTSWCSQTCTDAASLLETLENLDIDAIELEYRMSANVFSRLEEALRRSRLAVASIHNFFPAPPASSGLKPGGDVFPLSQPDRELRNRAVQLTTATIEHANRMEADRVVLHCGFVAMDHETDRLLDWYAADQMASEEAQAFLAQKLGRLEREKPTYLDALLFSLEKLIPTAERQGVVLGIENRFHYHELPGLDDFERIFSEFSGGPIGYWHDCGHAFTLEKLTVIQPGALLDAYGRHLVGIHIHDANGLDDHLPPGSGEIAFDNLAPFFDRGIPVTVELKPGTPLEALKEGLSHTRMLLAQSPT